MHRMYLTVLSGFTLIVLAGCGGSDGPTAPSGPTPTASPTPAPVQGLAINGESRMLSGTQAVQLWRPVTAIRAVYSFDNTGNRVDYAAGTDWLADGNTIRRTAGSRIPDFGSYRYVSNPDGTFSFNSEPRNPPLTINYNVYVDYQSSLSDKMVAATPVRSSIRSIKCIGDSITAGAHTVQNFYFTNDSQSWCALLRNQLKISGENQGVPGTGIGADIDSLTADHPDVVLIAFGMNDHTAGDAFLPSFKTQLDTAVKTVKSKNLSPILVGFFQQNKRYDQEHPHDTAAYNDAIREVATANGIPFVDIAPVFEKAALGAEPFRNLTADFLHHPNIYGQRLYFSAIIPYLLSANTLASDMPDYVIID